MRKNPHAVALGRNGGKKGGRAKTAAKKRASANNLKLARARRWPKEGNA
jgi:hypothetical protein